MEFNENVSPVDRLVATVVNAAEVARYGGLRTEHAPAPHDIVTHQPMYRLRRYFPDAPDGRPSVVLVPPLAQIADVWDVSPDTSAVRMLDAQGIDPWVVDFGDPATEPGGTERTFTDHVLAVVDAARRVQDTTGQDVHLGGYCQGGMFCYTATAYLGNSGIASVFTMGVPLTAHAAAAVMPKSLYRDLTRLQGKLVARTGVPRWMIKNMFNWMSPQHTIRNDIKFLFALHDRESLLPREPQRKFLRTEAWVSYPGPAYRELLEVLEDNRFLEGGLVIGDHTVGFADITCPILSFVGEADDLAPPAVVRTIVRAAPNADIYECNLPVGHFGLPVSSQAKQKTWPGVGAWVRWIDGNGGLPDYIHPLTEEPGQEEPARRGALSSLVYGAGLAAETGLRLPKAAARTGTRIAATVRDLSRDAITQAPRLLRLESMGPQTKISYAALLDDHASSSPDKVSFVFADRAYTHSDAKRRIDSVVRGLLWVGVRKGERVGVLMKTRPSALVTVAALNRIGAVAVLHRPERDVTTEIRLGNVKKIVADPEHARSAMKTAIPVFVLGGVNEQRRIPTSAVDLERVDPDTVRVPAWYRPNPGRARDIAFVLFNGTGAAIRADLITNGRWAASALAASSACALTDKDTVYANSPLHHPAGLLLSTAAATASGARLAMAAGFDPDTFWSEVRRYGATVVIYTRDMLRPLISGPAKTAEESHPIRLFVGSAMPTELWRQLSERFPSVNVLEMYASTRSDAILGNVSGRKTGSVGRPLPGTPKVRVVAMDGDQIRTGEDGYAILAKPDETGQLLVDASGQVFAGNDIPLRGVFKPDDSWIASGDMFRIDSDGDYWLVESAKSTANGSATPAKAKQKRSAKQVRPTAAVTRGLSPDAD